MSPKKGGLNKGRGLEALFGGGTRKNVNAENDQDTINIEETDSNKAKDTVKNKAAKSNSSKKSGTAAAKKKSSSSVKTAKTEKAGTKSQKSKSAKNKTIESLQTDIDALDDLQIKESENEIQEKDLNYSEEQIEQTEQIDIPDQIKHTNLNDNSGLIGDSDQIEHTDLSDKIMDGPENSEQSESLAGNNASAADVNNENSGVMDVKITMIIPNAEQPRREFDDASIEELAESIKIHGVLQPLLVQKKGKYYEIIAGERRWRAAKLVGLKEVPVIVRDYTPRQTLEISLIENIQRQDLNPIDEAFAYKRLLEEFSLTQAEVAKRVSKSRAVITNAMRLLKLEPRVQRMLIDNLITTGHARALLSIEDEELQFELANKIASEGLNVRETEKMINNLKKRPVIRAPKDKVQLESVYAPIEEQLKQLLGTKVQLHPKRSGKGTIEIEYYSGEDLERLVDLLSRSGEDHA